MASEPRRFVQGVPLGKPPPHVGPQPRARRDSANGWARSSRCKGGRARQAATIALALACVLVARRVVGGSFAAGEGIVASSSSAATRVAARASASERREALLRSREARGGAGDGATSDRGVDDNETAALPPLIKRACDCPECPSSSPSISSEKPSCDARVRDVEARANAWLSEVKARAERLTTLAKTDACAACGVPSHLAATESESSSSSGAGGGSARGGDADADASLPLPDLLATTRASAPSPPAPGTRRQKEVLGVCVPYRDRRDQLEVFSAYMKQHLDAQGVPFKIYVAEQSNQSAFNRGWALNAAFMNAERDGVAYVVMHDVDMLPLRYLNDVDSFRAAPVHTAPRTVILCRTASPLGFNVRDVPPRGRGDGRLSTMRLTDRRAPRRVPSPSSQRRELPIRRRVATRRRRRAPQHGGVAVRAPGVPSVSEVLLRGVHVDDGLLPRDQRTQREVLGLGWRRRRVLRARGQV